MILRITTLVLIAVAFAMLGYIQFASPNLVGTDGYYHLKLAHLMSNASLSEWPIDFPWLSSTVLNVERFSDHHFLFHVILIPFINDSMLVGGKWAAVFCATLAFAAFIYALPPFGFSGRILAAIGFFAISPGFLYRMSMVRAQSLSLAMLLLLFVVITKQRHKTAAILSFIYVWMYNAFPMEFVLLACYLTACYLIERQILYKLAFAVASGCVLGLVINPFFPNNIVFLFHHLIDKLTLGDYAVKVGNEWYPYSAKNFITHAGVAIACSLAALGSYNVRNKMPSKEVLTLCFFSLILLVLLIKSRRFVELYPIFSLLLLCWALYDNKFTVVSKSITAFALLLASLLSYYSVSAAHSSVSKAKPYTQYKTAAKWLEHNTEAETLIFTADWDDFPRLFHFNHHNHYLVGLDPYFMYAEDPQKFKLWRHITRGKLISPPSKVILERFATPFVFIDQKHKSFRKQLDKDQNAKKVFSSADSFIYRLSE